MEATLDPTCWIAHRATLRDGTPVTVYEGRDGDAWAIYGRCNCCGACEVNGAREDSLIWLKPAGEPWANLDPDYGKRLDLPVRPELRDAFASCSLYGIYLRRKGR